MNPVSKWFLTSRAAPLPRRVHGPLWLLAWEIGKTIKIISGLCMEVGQNDAPTFTVNMMSASFDNAFRHKCVINLGTAKTWGMYGCASQSSLNNSTTVAIAAGGGIQSRGPLMRYRLNQSSGVRRFSGQPPQALPFLCYHHELIHRVILPSALVSALCSKGINVKGLIPAIIPFSRSPRDKPSMPDLSILVPAMWMM